MRFNTTEIPDVFTIDLTPFEDHRGMFVRVFCQQEFAGAGLITNFVQANQSITKRKGTIRGLHYQFPPFAEVKVIRCVRGAVYDVAVDIRKESPTFLKHVVVELSQENNRMIYIPEGFAHGFQTLCDDTCLIYQHSAYYQPVAEGGIRYDDPKIAISWPLKVTDVSDKDKNLIFTDDFYEGINI
jgi:dTDP-4-dehydrorhamnose 3,5-epimerase